MANPTVQIAIVYTPGSGLAIAQVSRDLRSVTGEVEAANRRVAANLQSSQAALGRLGLVGGVIARAQLESQQRFVQLIENSRRGFADLVVLQKQSLGLTQQQQASSYAPLLYSALGRPTPPLPPRPALGYTAPYARSGGYLPSNGLAPNYLPYGNAPAYGTAGMYNTGGAAPLQLGSRGQNWGAPPPSLVGGGIAALGGGPPSGPGMFAGLSGVPGGFNWNNFIKGANLGQNSLNALTGTISNLQMIVTRLAFTGFRILIGEILGITGAVYKLSQSFLEINEKFATFQIMLSSILKSATQASDIRSEITRITATSPIPFEGLAELVKSLAIIPGTRQGLINQAQSGKIQDPEGFLQRSVRMVEQMLTFRPDKRVEDAIFSIREALSGEFRSLVRRFDIPVSSIAAYSGVPIQQLKKDPQKALQAMQELFDQLVNPEAVREAARQPSKLFQNIMEQLFTNPILALGTDTKIKQTGKSLYDSILQPFQVLLGQATQFSQNKRVGNIEIPGSSPLASFSQKAAEPIYEMFTKAMQFLAESLEQVLAKYGIKSTPGATLMERISGAIVEGLDQLNQNFIPMLEKARKVLFGLFTVMKGLADAVAWFLDKFGESIANHPVLSLLAVSSLRGVTVDLVRTIAGGVGGAYKGAAVAGAIGPLGSGAMGAGLAAGATALTTSVVAALGAPIVIAAVWGLVQEFRSRISAEKAQDEYATQAGQNVSANAFSPMEIANALREYRTLALRRQELDNRSPEDYARYGKPDTTEVNDLMTRQEKLLSKMGITDTQRIFAENASGMVGNITLIDSAIEKIQKQNAEWEKSGNLIQRNTNYIQEMIDAGKMNPNIFSRSISNEKAFPNFAAIRADNVGFDSTKGLASPEADALITQLTEKERPLDTLSIYSRTLQQAMEGIKKTGEGIDATFGNTSALQNEAANFSLIVSGTLSELVAHPSPGKLFTDFVTGETKTYEQYVESLSNILTALRTTTTAGQPVMAVQEKIREMARLFMASDDTIDKSTTAALTGIVKFHEQITNFEGTSDKASTLTDSLIDQIRMLDLLPNKVLEDFRQNITDGIAEKGSNKIDKSRAQEVGADVLVDLVKAIADALMKFKEGAFKKLEETTGILQRQINDAVSMPSDVYDIGKSATSRALGLPYTQTPLRPSGIVNSPGELPKVFGDVISKIEGAGNKAGKTDQQEIERWAQFIRERAIKQIGSVFETLINFEGDASTALAISRFRKDRDIAGVPSNVQPNFSILSKSTMFLGEGGQDIQLDKLKEAERVYSLLADDFERQGSDLSQSKGEREKFIQQMDEMREKAAKVHDEFQKLQSGGLGVSLFHGLQESLSVSMNSLSDLRDMGKQIGDSLKLNLGNAFYDFISGASNAGDAFKKFGQSVLQTAAQIAAQKAAGALLGILFSVVGGVLGSAFGASTGGVTASAGGWNIDKAGNIIGGAAEGGVVGGSGRTMMHVGEEGPEFVFTNKATRNIGIENLYSMMHAAERGHSAPIEKFGQGGSVQRPPGFAGGYVPRGFVYYSDNGQAYKFNGNNWRQVPLGTPQPASYAGDQFDPNHFVDPPTIGGDFPTEDVTPPPTNYTGRNTPLGSGNTNYTLGPDGGMYVYDGNWNYAGLLDSNGRWVGPHFSSDIYSGNRYTTPGRPSDLESTYQSGFNQFIDSPLSNQRIFNTNQVNTWDIGGNDVSPQFRGTAFARDPSDLGNFQGGFTDQRIYNQNDVPTWDINNDNGWQQNARGGSITDFAGSGFYGTTPFSGFSGTPSNYGTSWSYDSDLGWVPKAQENFSSNFQASGLGGMGGFGGGVHSFSGFGGATSVISFNRVLPDGQTISTGGDWGGGGGPVNLMGQAGLFADGGFIKGGSKIKDDVLILGMGGEFVVNQAAANYYGPKMMHDINTKRLKRMAHGGYMGSEPAGGSSGGITIHMPINVAGGGGGMSAEERKRRQDQAQNLKPLLRNAVLDVITEQQRPGGILHSS